jgi:hypothetical protein
MRSLAGALVALPSRVAPRLPRTIEPSAAGPRFGVRRAPWAYAVAAAALAAGWVLLWCMFLVGVVWPAARL